MKQGFTKQDMQQAQARAEHVTGVKLPFAVEAARGEGLCVTLEGGAARIAAEDENALTRGFFLLCRCVLEGRDGLSVCQKRHFTSCGAMVDCSRGAVMKPEAVRRYIDRLACLGMNLLMLYTEDTYEVPEYPYLGHLRGRYSQGDLRELDAYAAAAGVELVPCIQTLGHMRQFLQWQDSAALRDQMDILMIDDERTYAFIEAEIRAMRACMRTDRIHIGMDEAHGVGLGQYMLRHGQTDRFALLNRHLKRVCAICERYGFRPIMWSDMFFRLGSKTNSYYDPDSDIPQAVIDAIPPVDLCYWDYYHTDEAFYDRMLAEHARMGGRTVFAGGIWTWSGFLPQVKRTGATMFPALRACARSGVDTVLATMWGDDAAETDVFLACGLLPIFSESCWQGVGCPQEEMTRMGEALTGMPQAALDAMGAFYPNEKDVRTGKSLIWCDPLYPLHDWMDDTPEAAIARCEEAAAVLDGLNARQERLEYRYALALLDVAMEKAYLVRDLRGRYVAGDRAYLRETADATLTRIHQKLDALMRLHRTLWERDMKRNGWEVLALRYGAAMGRLLDAADEITRYLDGTLATIEELDEAPLPPARIAQHFEHLVTPSAGMGTGF